MINKNEAIKNNIKVVDNSIKNELFENLKTNFPQTIIEGKADLKAISLLLGLDKKSDISGYELTWTGKGLSNALYSSPCNKELKLEEIFSNADCHASLRSARNDGKKDCHCEATAEAIQKIDCHDFATQNLAMTNSNNPKNIIIRGDNLDVLKILKSAYSEKIKMIYIDPPYNTTNENFIYPDNFRQDYKKILEEVGLIEIDENGEEVESEDLKFFKNIQGSRTHSGWLSFMLPRLKLARDLLKEDGVIFISIDDNEQANLKLLCDEIFGEDNFVSCFVWQKKSGGGQAKYFYEGHEYILIYCKNKDLLQGLFKIKEKGKIETDFLRKIHGKYTNNLKLKNVYEKYPNQLIEHRNLMFEEMDIFLQEKLITQEKYDEIKQNLTNGIYFLKPYNDKFHLVCRNNENNQALMYSIISGVWTSDGNTENEELFGQLVFNDPKPINLLKQLIQSVTMQGNSNDLF